MQSSRSWLLLIGFLALVVGGGWAIGYLNRPGTWYADLAKPFFTPPGWLFGPVWTFLYVLIAIAGWSTARDRLQSLPMTLWCIQLLLNFSWSPIFFSAHNVGFALVVVITLTLVNLAFIIASWRHDCLAALLFVPYAAWTAFAALLNGAILSLN